MADNKFNAPLEKGEPLKVNQLVVGEYYEDILSGQLVLVVREGTVYDEPTAKNADDNKRMIEVTARYYNRVTGLIEDFRVADNQLRKWK